MVNHTHTMVVQTRARTGKVVSIRFTTEQLKVWEDFIKEIKEDNLGVIKGLISTELIKLIRDRSQRTEKKNKSHDDKSNGIRTKTNPVY